jgi:Protein of unknown function (DUF4240)
MPVVEITLDELWEHIEQCHAGAAGMREFSRLLESLLDTWALPKLAAFHWVMWSDIGVYHEERDRELWELMYQAADYVGSDNSWDSYGGWLIAQGREFFEAVMRDSQVALTRVSPGETEKRKAPKNSRARFDATHF